MNLPLPLIEIYLADPLKHDAAVRTICKIPDNRYFTVSVWPVAGRVTVDKRQREITTKKISKSP